MGGLSCYIEERLSTHSHVNLEERLFSFRAVTCLVSSIDFVPLTFLTDFDTSQLFQKTLRFYIIFFYVIL